MNAPRTLAACAVLAALAVAGPAAPVPAERVKEGKELAALAARLHGSWRGGPCVGTLSFRADGTYEWADRGPGTLRDDGTWALRKGEGGVTVLVRRCKTSGVAARKGKTVELKVAEVTAKAVVLRDEEGGGPGRFKRVEEAARR